MTSEEAAAQEELREWTRQQSSLIHWLREIAANLPGPPLANLPLDDPDEGPSAADEIRATLQCVLADHLEPALRDVDDAARYRPVRKRPLGKRSGE
jgi:hypothetical protein